MDFDVGGSSAQASAVEVRRGRATIAGIVAITALLVLRTWALVLRQIDFETQKAIRSAIAQNDDRSVMLQQYVSQTLATANLASLHIAKLSAMGSMPVGTRQRPALIDDAIARDRGFLGLSIVNSAGELVATTLDTAERTANVGSHPAFVAHKSGDTGQLFVSKPTYSRLLRSHAIWLTRRLNRPDGSFAGVAAINVEPRQLIAVFGQTAVKPSESAWVVGLDGTIRARMTGGQVTSGEDVSRGELFSRQMRAESGAYAGYGTIDRKLRLVSHRRVPNYPLFVSYSILHDEALREPRRRAQYFIAGAALATLAALLLAAMLIHVMRLRERRARELAVAKARLEDAQRIARIGDWAYRFEPPETVWSPHLYEMYERYPALGPMTEEELALCSPDSLERNRQSMERVLEGMPTSWELKVRLPSGRTRFHRVSAVPTRDAHGAIVGFHGTTQDVTELKKLEAMQDELAHLSRVGALNALTATLSHELNQPLTAASNYLTAGQYAAERLSAEPAGAVAEFMKDARVQVLRAGEIIQRMRKLVSSGAAERSVESVDDIVAESLAVISMTKICSDPITSQGFEDELFVDADAVQIQQVILNLVRNACEAQKDREAPPPHLEVSARADGMVLVRVIDNGPGFSEDLRAKLYEPFMSSKQSGLGLGLSISRTIIEAHGGTLQAENRPSGGAIVSFTLPLHSRKAREATPHSGQGEDAPLH